MKIHSECQKDFSSCPNFWASQVGYFITPLAERRKYSTQKGFQWMRACFSLVPAPPGVWLIRNHVWWNFLRLHVFIQNNGRKNIRKVLLEFIHNRYQSIWMKSICESRNKIFRAFSCRIFPSFVFPSLVCPFISDICPVSIGWSGKFLFKATSNTKFFLIYWFIRWSVYWTIAQGQSGQQLYLFAQFRVALAKYLRINCLRRKCTMRIINISGEKESLAIVNIWKAPW